MINQQLLHDVDALLLEAGQDIAMRYFRNLSDDDINSKSHADDLVTIADVAIDKFLINGLADILPNAQFITEETHHDNTNRNHDDYIWIIDPIDGTWHYAHGEPNFCSMIALVHQGQTLAAWLHFPYDKVSYYSHADSNNSVTCHHHEHNITTDIMFKAQDKEALDGMMMSFIVADHQRETFKSNFVQQIGNRHHIRSCGYVTRLMLDQKWDFSYFASLKSWDHAPICFLIEQAGGFFHYGSLFGQQEQLQYCPDKTAHQLMLCNNQITFRKIQSFLNQFQSSSY